MRKYNTVLTFRNTISYRKGKKRQELYIVVLVMRRISRNLGNIWSLRTCLFPIYWEIGMCKSIWFALCTFDPLVSWILGTKRISFRVGRTSSLSILFIQQSKRKKRIRCRYSSFTYSRLAKQLSWNGNCISLQVTYSSLFPFYQDCSLLFPFPCTKHINLNREELLTFHLRHISPISCYFFWHWIASSVRLTSGQAQTRIHIPRWSLLVWFQYECCKVCRYIIENIELIQQK